MPTHTNDFPDILGAHEISDTAGWHGTRVSTPPLGGLVTTEKMIAEIS